MAGLYADPNLVEEIFVDTLDQLGLDRDVALRVADGDANYPWSSLVRALKRIATAYGHPDDDSAEARTGLARIVGELFDSLRAEGDLRWLARTDHPGSLLLAHLHRLARAAR